MGFRINTNVAALDAHRAAMGTNRSLDKSLASLSSGLRINKAADDASGMTIADSLRSQAQGLGQAISNANDGVALVQTADGALDEYINIINSVRTKSIQAASDGQNADSRKAIQADIDRLLGAADSIANTTQFNGQKLLDGSFTNKAFHIGAYAGETVGFSVGNVQTSSVGDINSVKSAGGRTALLGANFAETAAGNVLSANQLTINNTDISSVINTLSPNALTDASNIASAITKATGIMAQGTNVLSGSDVLGGTIDSTTSLQINGISIADTVVSAGDADGALSNAINAITSQTGVTAATVNGKLELTSLTGANISVGGSATAQVDTFTFTTGDVAETGDVYTFSIAATTTGATPTAINYTVTATDLTLNDVSAGIAAKIAATPATAALVTGASDTNGNLVLTAADPTVSFTSSITSITDRADVLTSGANGTTTATGTAAFAEVQTLTFTALGAGETATVGGLIFTSTTATTATNVAAAFASLTGGSAAGDTTNGTWTGSTTLDSSAWAFGSAAATANSAVLVFTATANGDATDLTLAGSSAGVVPGTSTATGGLGNASEATVVFTSASGGIDVGDIFSFTVNDGTNTATINYTATRDDTLDNAMAQLVTLFDASSGGVAAAAYFGGNGATIAATGTGATRTLTVTSAADSVTGEFDGTDVTLDASGTSNDLLNDSTLTSGTTPTGTSSYAITGLTDTLTQQAGTAVAGLAAASTTVFTVAKGDLVINGKDMAGVYGDAVNPGSAASEFMLSLNSISGMENSTLSANGTLALVVNNGNDLNIAGTTAVSTFGLTEGITNDSKAGEVSIFSDQNVQVAGTDAGDYGFVQGNYTPSSNGTSLNDINVTDRDNAEIAILIADSALKQLDATRSDLGSVQNQLESTIRNISVTQVNVTAAESNIRDVDFAQESANFAKFNILAQSGSYAMSQANAVQQNVLRLLQ